MRFADGTEATVDAVVLATGYAPELPYLAAQPARAGRADVRRRRGPGSRSSASYVVHGPAFPVLELQARFVAAVWAGERSVADAPPLPELPHYPHHVLAEAFAAGARRDCPTRTRTRRSWRRCASGRCSASATGWTSPAWPSASRR